MAVGSSARTTNTRDSPAASGVERQCGNALGATHAPSQRAPASQDASSDGRSAGHRAHVGQRHLDAQAPVGLARRDRGDAQVGAVLGEIAAQVAVDVGLGVELDRELGAPVAHVLLARALDVDPLGLARIERAVDRRPARLARDDRVPAGGLDEPERPPWRPRARARTCTSPAWPAARPGRRPRRPPAGAPCPRARRGRPSPSNSSARGCRGCSRPRRSRCPSGC